MRIFGFIPSRMGSKRLPGKALKKIGKNTLTEEVFIKSKKFKKWNELAIAICDLEIKKLLLKKKIPFVMTSKSHIRCLDRVCEAATKNKKIKKNDIVVCIQGDEVMVTADMIKKLVAPFKYKQCNSTILSMKINNINEYKDKNVVKLISDNKKKVLIGSRSPIPYMKTFKKGVAKKIIGIYAFRFESLIKFKNTNQTFLEKVESCDTNRICESSGDLYEVEYPFRKIIAIDTKNDLIKVRQIYRNKSVN